MPRYFECLHCHLITPVEATTPKCPRCGHGTGVIHSMNPEKAGQKKGDEPKITGGGATKPDGSSRILAVLKETTGLQATIPADALPGAATPEAPQGV